MRNILSTLLLGICFLRGALEGTLEGIGEGIGEGRKGVTPKQDKDGIRAALKMDVSLPNVLIIGDSISIGYTKPVIVLMKGKANVQRAKANCGDTIRGLSSLKKWLGDTRWDVIHFNWGLHDLCYRHPDSKEQGRRDKKSGTQAVSLEQYAKNLEAIVQEFRKLEPSSYGRQRPSCPEAK